MSTECYISVRDMQYSYYCDGFKITAITDVACHLYMRWSTNHPWKHIVPRLMRGIRMHDDIYLCFVAYHDNEQEEAGDTHVHTFIKRGWPICQTRWFYFWGKQAGQTCKSTTALFSLHFAIEHETYLDTPSNRTTRKADTFWNVAHDAAIGTILTNWNAPWYLIFAGAYLSVRYFIYRGHLFFDTTSIPIGSEIAGGWLSLFSFEHKCTSSVIYPYLQITRGVQQDPVIPADYGYQLPFTTVGGQKDYRTFIDNAYNNIELNEQGAGFIQAEGITRLCLRAELDVGDHVPPFGTNWLKFYSHQKGAGYRPLLTLCHPPGSL